MTWRDAKTDALARIAKMGLPEGSLDGHRIVCSEYADDKAYRFACGMRNWTLAYYQMVNKATFRELRRRGAKVERRLITWEQLVTKE